MLRACTLSYVDMQSCNVPTVHAYHLEAADQVSVWGPGGCRAWVSPETLDARVREALDHPVPLFGRRPLRKGEGGARAAADGA